MSPGTEVPRGVPGAQGIYIQRLAISQKVNVGFGLKC